MLDGKYLNSEPCDPLPEFDRWVCATHPPEGTQPNDYTNVDPTLNVDGTFTHFDGYIAQILADQAADFIQSTPEDQPFFLMYTPPTPHKPADDDRMKSKTHVDDHRPPSFDQDPAAAGQPPYMARGPLTDDEINAGDRLRKNMAVSVRGLDESIDTILSALGDRANNTLVVYLSDNGYLFGEHRAEKKQWPYEEAVRVPMAVRFPTLLPSGQPPSDALVTNIDLAPTIMSLAGIPWGGDGVSLVPLLRGDVESVHDNVLISFCEGPSYPCGPHGGGGGGDSDADPADVQHVMPAWQGLVGERWKYLSYSTGDEELYDLEADPNELHNLVADPAHAADRQTMADALAARVAAPPPETTIVSGPGPGPLPSFTYFSQTIDATYECRVVELNATWAQCPRQQDTLQGLAPGTYTFEVRATDATGATDESPATRGFTVGA
jgi:arylsulfatase A-like enzyme